MVTKKTPTKTVAKKTTARKAVAKTVAKAPVKDVAKTAPVEKPAQVSAVHKTEGHVKLGTGRYIFATGRRKTAVANIRMFSGSGDNMVNKVALKEYFSEKGQQDTALRPFALTGLMDDYYFVASINGGGRTSQVEALRHGIAQTLAGLNDDIRNILKKNGFLTRDDRKKERKKPGLRGARRAPQWAKR